MLDEEDMLSNKWGANYDKISTKQTVNARIKKLVAETTVKGKQSYRETTRQIKINDHI